MLITIHPADGHCGGNKRGIWALSLIQTSAEHPIPVLVNNQINSKVEQM